jgi:ABC-type uncharacterized transport system ATPase component
MLDEHTANLDPAQKQAILSDNTAALYGIDTAALAADSASAR